MLSIAARAHAKSLHALWPIRALTLPPAPIRTRQSSCANRDAVTCRHAYPAKGEFLDFSARHAKTRTPHATTRYRLYVLQYKFASPLSVFGHRAILSLGLTTKHLRSMPELLQRHMTTCLHLPLVSVHWRQVGNEAPPRLIRRKLI